CDLPAGPVTRRQIFELLPFDNDVVAVTLSGAQVLAFVRRSVEAGRHTGLDFSGLTVFVERAPAGTLRVARLAVGGRALDPAAQYTVATNSFLAEGGDGAVELQAGTSRRTDPALLREVMEDVFAREKKQSMPADAKARWVEEVK
ncbi:MAG TPA: 5'-nucleotidase, partial [Planctomycetota bacterium]|nr:5'-nucleotidase [Planctomycetota bacterium]